MGRGTTGTVGLSVHYSGTYNPWHTTGQLGTDGGGEMVWSLGFPGRNNGPSECVDVEWIRVLMEKRESDTGSRIVRNVITSTSGSRVTLRRRRGFPVNGRV